MKKMSLRLFWLAVFLSCTISTQTIFDENDFYYHIAKKFAPQYVPLTPEEVDDQSDYPNGSCEKFLHSNYTNKYQYEACKKIKSLSEHMVIVEHEKVFDRIEIDPIKEKILAGFLIMFWIIYLVIALSAILTVGKWFSGGGRRAIGLRMAKLSEVSQAAAPNLKELTAQRKLRKAEEDFRTLKNLYDNGLIDEEMFAKRKEALKSVLDSNELFRKETP